MRVINSRDRGNLLIATGGSVKEPALTVAAAIFFGINQIGVVRRHAGPLEVLVAVCFFGLAFGVTFTVVRRQWRRAALFAMLEREVVASIRRRRRLGRDRWRTEITSESGRRVAIDSNSGKAAILHRVVQSLAPNAKTEHRDPFPTITTHDSPFFG